MKRFFTLFILLILFTAGAFSAQKTWTGNRSSDFAEENNWNPKGVPAEYDDVTIPSGTRECKMTGGTHFLRSLTNDGELSIDGGTVLTNTFDNSGTLDIGSNGATFYKQTNSSVDYANSGTIEGAGGSVMFCLGSILPHFPIPAVFENSGTIEVKVFILKTKDFTNNGLVEALDVRIDDCDKLVNSDRISGRDVESGNGGSILIKTNDLNCTGSISGGDGGDDGHGGSIEIYGTGHHHYLGGLFGGTGGENGGLGGNISCIGPSMVEIGCRVLTGYSNGGYKAGKDDGDEINDLPERADLTLIGDSVDIFTHDQKVDVGAVHLRAKKISFNFIEQSGNFIAYKDVHMYTSPEGIVDFGQVHVQLAISSFGEIHIYTTHLIEPFEGINYVCDPHPIIHDADLDVRGANVYVENRFLKTRPDDSLLLVLQNNSTSEWELEYEISSAKGWVDEVEGTAEAKFFTYRELYPRLTIPPHTELGEIDTVTAIVKILGQPMDTATSYIYCQGILVPEVPDLLEPQYGEEDVDINTTFNWIWTESDYFTLQVATDMNFENLLIDEQVTGSEYTVAEPFDWTTEYYWRMKTMLYEIESDWSNTRSFTTQQIPLCAQVELAGPEDGYKDSPRETVLSWSPVQYARSYQLQIKKDDIQFQDADLDEETTETSFDVSGTILPNSLYNWRVRAINESGEGEWSAIWHFLTADFNWVDERGNVITGRMSSAYPNPSGGEVYIEFNIERFTRASIAVYDISGRKIAELTSNYYLPGIHKVTWKPSGLPAGAYYYTIETDHHSESGQIILK